MLQDLIRSDILLAPSAPRRQTAKRMPASAVPAPASPDLDKCSLDNLAELADLAYRVGDRALAEHCVRGLYAAYDRQQSSRHRVALEQSEIE